MIHTNAKHTIAAILLALLSAFSAACGGTEPEGSVRAADTTVQPAEPENPIKPSLPEKDYTGEEFVFYTRPGDPIFTIEEMTGDPLDDKNFQIRRDIEEQYGITIKEVKSSDNNAADALSSIMAGEDAYDAILPFGRTSFTYAGEGALLDWEKDLPYVDLDKPYWNADAREGFTIGGKLYVMVGDILLTNLSAANCMMFNKTLLDKYDIEYPYSLVREGAWTLDKLAELSRGTLEDLNGDAAYTIDKDQFGYVTTQWGGPMQVLYSANQRICRKDEDGLITLSLNNDKVIATFEKYFSIMTDLSCFLETTGQHDGVKAAFREGRVAFFDCLVTTTTTYRDMTDDFGIIPFPKADETVDKYYCNVDGGTSLICIPITVGNPEMVSMILEDMCWRYYDEMMPLYYNELLAMKVSRDDDSSEMLDYIRDGRVFDIGYFYNGLSGAFVNTGRELAISNDHNFASFYAANEASALAKIKEINGLYQK